MCAILTCAQSLHTQHDQSIVICSDSQAALKALQSPKTTSRLVIDTVTVLKELSVFNSVRLLWVPGHSGVDGNEVADLLATQASYSDFIGPEPAIGITVNSRGLRVFVLSFVWPPTRETTVFNNQHLVHEAFRHRGQMRRKGFP